MTEGKYIPGRFLVVSDFQEMKFVNNMPKKRQNKKTRRMSPTEKVRNTRDRHEEMEGRLMSIWIRCPDEMMSRDKDRNQSREESYQCQDTSRDTQEKEGRELR